MAVFLALLLPAVAAVASWYLAGRQGRSAKAWAIWTFVLAGLPLILLLIMELFALPKFGNAIRYSCCEEMAWAPVADFGHVRGVDLDLGRCQACGAYLMAVYRAGSTTNIVISDDQARHWLSLEGTDKLKQELRSWVD
jgi:hypothetical protein